MQNQDPQPPQSNRNVIIDVTAKSAQAATVSAEQLKSLRTIVLVVYVLQALSYFVGITAIIGVIISYIKRGDAAGTWLASHFRWQIRTFWFGLLWAVIGLLLMWVFVGGVILIACGIWIIYRIVRGALAALDNKPLQPR